MTTRLFAFLLIVLAFAGGCRKDCPTPLPDCWNPDVPYELIEPDTNTCLTETAWAFHQVWLGGSEIYPASYGPINTFPHTIRFSTAGLYYIVHRGDTVQSGRLKHHDYQYSPFSPPNAFTIEFFADCVESDTFLLGVYGAQCTGTLLTITGTHYAYGEQGIERTIDYILP